MKLRLFKSFWGMEGSDEEKLMQIKADGYDGFEAPMPQTDEEADALRALRIKYDLPCVCRIHTHGPDFFASFKEQVLRGIRIGCVRINSHTGRDTMSEAQLDELFTKVSAFERTISTPVTHETHRSRPTYAPWSTAALLRKFPEISLTADFSHWCCVCESLLADQQDTMDLCCERTGYIHARVGYTQGPQAPDPAAPEYADALEAHERWWSAVAKNLSAKGEEEMMVMVEYGPPFYMHTLPHMNVPVADLRKVCLWGRERFRAMYNGLGLG